MISKIYWAPVLENENLDWSILYKDPKILFNNLKSKVRKDIDKQNNLIYCPVVKNLTDKIAVFKCPLTTHFIIDNEEIIIKSKNHMEINKPHDNNFLNNFLFSFKMSYIFFSEDDLNMTITSPFFSNSNHLKYGSLIPGTFNISNWFRNINLEFNLWDNNKEFKIEEDEDMMYCFFDTKNDIELIRFDLSNRAKQIMHTCGQSSNWEKFVPLYKRYKRFKESKMRNILVKEIKNNIIESE